MPPATLLEHVGLLVGPSCFGCNGRSFPHVHPMPNATLPPSNSRVVTRLKCLACWSSAGLSSLFPFFDSNLLVSLLEHAVGTYLPLLSFWKGLSKSQVEVLKCPHPVSFRYKLGARCLGVGLNWSARKSPDHWLILLFWLYSDEFTGEKVLENRWK